MKATLAHREQLVAIVFAATSRQAPRSGPATATTPQWQNAVHRRVIFNAPYLFASDTLA